MGSCLSAESRSPLPGSPLSPHLANMKRRNLRKRLGSRSSSCDYRKDKLLHRIPGRLFLNGSSDVASLYSQQGKKGTNQDAMIVWENFCSRTDTVFCGVFDGHGPYGHLVAKRVRDRLPLKLSAHWDVNMSSEDAFGSNAAGSTNSEDMDLLSVDEESRASEDLKETEKYPDIFEMLKGCFLKAYKAMDRELRMHPSVDCFCSGTTAVTLVKQLTVDLKPNLPAEAERIRRCKGRVYALADEPEVTRVWLPNNDSPGLAMARAFGDFCLKDFGLISVPEVSYRHLSEKDEFVVLATDGIWDVLSNKEVVDIIASAPARSYAARALVEVAVRAWKYKYPTSKVDDCAVVCLFLDSNLNNLSVASNAKTKVQPTLENQVDDDIDADEEEKENLDVLIPLVQSGTVEETLDDNEDGSKHEEMNSVGGMDWSALEGVSRVNTLVNLPRFIPEKEDKEGFLK
ncbi:putative protein phosphatase 2C 33 [Hibiscus syriacus]|uniref:PPM-type phosphatase domain-containing protein n=1 Tax=Hibiscus syriacus TaxID=106335 RepID=A0A6A2ZI72_HIBSY|nr:putative protein phosphatase 2C 33 [Hibiscus syriacus]